MTAVKRLETYLNDHLAGATAGSELANKISAEYQGTQFGPFLSELASEIKQDRAALEDLIARLGMQHDALKQAAGWLGERLSRLKLSDTMTGDSDLKRLLEFETLALGIEGKRSMWRALLEVTDSHPELAATDLNTLAKRAENQRTQLEEYRLQVVKPALTG